MTRSQDTIETKWSIPVRMDDVPEEGLHVAIAADEATRAAIAAIAGVEAVLRLEANFDVVRRGNTGLAVMGDVTARVRQTCVVTLEPIETDINEPIGVHFAPQAAEMVVDGELTLEPTQDDGPEALVDGVADLGRLATEFMVLAVDRYPRKAGGEFQPPPVPDAGGSPFDVLAALKKDRNQPS